MDIIVFILIISFIRKAIKKQKEQKPVTQSVPNQRRQQDRPVQRTAQAQRDVYSYQQQQSTKERLQKKYGLQQPLQKSDILSRAKENVQEMEADALQQEVHAEVCRDYRETSHKAADVEVHRRQSVNCDTEEESDILKRVDDLMITGYSGDMQFDRDFIAEGVEMLNRFSF